MPYKKVLQKKAKCDPAIWDYLNDEYEGNSLDVFLIEGSKSERESLWNEYRNEILERWINEQPGTRPSLWWEFESPGFRKMAKGKAVAAWLKLAVAESYYKGIPNSYYFIDKNDPPYFESEAAYLRRHDLLHKEEVEKLTDSDYELISLEEIPYYDYDWDNFKRSLNENY